MRILLGKDGSIIFINIVFKMWFVMKTLIVPKLR